MSASLKLCNNTDGIILSILLTQVGKITKLEKMSSIITACSYVLFNKDPNDPSSGKNLINDFYTLSHADRMIKILEKSSNQTNISNYLKEYRQELYNIIEELNNAKNFKNDVSLAKNTINNQIIELDQMLNKNYEDVRCDIEKILYTKYIWYKNTIYTPTIKLLDNLTEKFRFFSIFIKVIQFILNHPDQPEMPIFEMEEDEAKRYGEYEQSRMMEIFPKNKQGYTIYSNCIAELSASILDENVRKEKMCNMKIKICEFWEEIIQDAKFKNDYFTYLSNIRQQSVNIILKHMTEREKVIKNLDHLLQTLKSKQLSVLINNNNFALTEYKDKVLWRDILLGLEIEVMYQSIGEYVQNDNLIELYKNARVVISKLLHYINVIEIECINFEYGTKLRTFMCVLDKLYNLLLTYPCVNGSTIIQKQYQSLCCILQHFVSCPATFELKNKLSELKRINEDIEKESKDMRISIDQVSQLRNIIHLEMNEIDRILYSGLQTVGSSTKYIESLIQERNILTEIINNLKQEKKTITTQIPDFDINNPNLKNLAKSHYNNFKTIIENIESIDKKENLTDDDLQNEIKKLSKLQSSDELDKLETKCEELLNDLETKSSEIDVLQSELDTVKTKITACSTLEKNQIKLEDEINLYKLKVEELDNIKTLSDNKDTRIESLENDLNESKVKIETLQKTIDETPDPEIWNAAEKELNDKLEAKTKEYDVKKAEFEELHDKYKIIEKSNEMYEKLKIDYENILNSNKSLETKQEEISELLNKCKSELEEEKNKSKRVDELSEQINNLQYEINSLTEKEKAYVDEIDELKQSLSEATKNLSTNEALTSDNSDLPSISDVQYEKYKAQMEAINKKYDLICNDIKNKLGDNYFNKYCREFDKFVPEHLKTKFKDMCKLYSSEKEREKLQTCIVQKFDKDTIADTIAEFTKRYENAMDLISYVNEIAGVGLVYVRINPNPHNAESSQGPVVSVNSENSLSLLEYTSKNGCHFPPITLAGFSKVYEFNTTTLDIYNDIKSYITAMSVGYNIVILGYGQSGSGKTFTMFGSQSVKTSIFSCTIRTIIDMLGNQLKSASYSMVQIYGTSQTTGTMFDMSKQNKSEILDTNYRNRNAKFKTTESNIKIKSIEQAEKYKITKSTQPEDIIKTFDSKRFTRSTPNNKESSRAHAFVKVDMTFAASNGKPSKTQSILFGDLCGNENVLALIGDQNITEWKSTSLWNESLYINESLRMLKDYVIPCVRRKDRSTPPASSDVFLNLLNDILDFKNNAKYCSSGSRKIGSVKPVNNKLILFLHIIGCYGKNYISTTDEQFFRDITYKTTASTLYLGAESLDIFGSPENKKQLTESVKFKNSRRR